MTLPKIPCVPPLDELRREIDRLVESCLGTTPGALIRGHGIPPVDVWEEPGGLVVQAEVPGVAMADLQVYARGHELTLKATRPTITPEGSAIHRREQHTGPFERTISLPVEIDPEHVEATLKDGLLTIRVPRPATAGARKVTIRGSEPEPGTPA